MTEQSYSKLWRYRYLWSFIITSILLTMAVILTQGASSIVEDSSSLWFIILVFGVFYCYGQYRERILASKVSIKNETLEIHCSNKASHVRFEEISHRKLLKAGKTFNGFGMPELLIETEGGSTFRIPTNIKNYKDIERAVFTNEQ